MVFAPFLPAQGLTDIRLNRNTLGVPHGWFYLHLLVSLSSQQGKELLNNFPTHFEPTQIVEEDWYRTHLTESEFQQLSSETSIEMFKIPKHFDKQTLATEKPGMYLVEAYKGWTPKYKTGKKTHIGYGFFVVEGAKKSDLQNDEDIISVEPYKYNTVDNRYTAGFLQNGRDELVSENSHYWTSRSLAEKGISGEGQIITVCDSGLDTNHSFFYDKDHPVPYNKTDYSHRKIVHYAIIVDHNDVEEGHGTHVSGTLAGNSWDNMSEASLYNGVAPNAKIYFFDLGNSTNPTVVHPYNIEDAIAQSENDGSGIMSNSFGSTSFTSETYTYDLTCWKHKNYLIAKSAGNRKGRGTVGSFADAVNVFTVGNTFPTSVQQIETLSESNYSISQSTDHNNQLNLNFVSNASTNIFLDENNHLRDMMNLTISNVPNKDSIYLLQKLETSQEFETAMTNAKNNNVLFVIYDENQIVASGYQYPVPCFSATTEIMQILQSYSTVSFFVYPKQYREMRMHQSSSEGPGYSGILKPDISGPGTYITSAKSVGPKSTVTNDTSRNTLMTKSGTSMSTPAIAGAASLLREYFMKGYYPSGQANDADSIKTPTAALLKAALINVANPLSQSIVRNNSWGYGIPNLEQAMGFDGSGVIYLDNVTISPNESHQYTIDVPEDGSLFVSMAYTDIPNHYTDKRPLTTYINLNVEDPDHKVTPGNHNQDNFDEIYSTMSKVRLVQAKKGKYTIFITASDYNSQSYNIEYSLAIRGTTIKTQKIQRNTDLTCPGNCSGVGKCVNGKCVCPILKAGTYCQTPVYAGAMNKTVQLNILINEGPCWLAYPVSKGKRYNFTIDSDPNNIGLRYCITDEKGPVGNKNMKCYQSGLDPVRVTNISSSKNVLYIIAFRGYNYGESSASIYEYTPQETTGGGESGGESGNTGDHPKTPAFSKQSIIVIAVMAVIIVALLVAVIIISIKKRNSTEQTDASLANPLV